MITARVKCTKKEEMGEGESRQASVHFSPDYEDGRNKEWSLYTPGLSLAMTLKGAVADKFEVGDCFTLQFVKEEGA